MDISDKFSMYANGKISVKTLLLSLNVDYDKEVENIRHEQQLGRVLRGVGVNEKLILWEYDDYEQKK